MAAFRVVAATPEATAGIGPAFRFPEEPRPESAPGCARCDAALVLSVPTLQFVPIECRQSLVQRIHDSLAPGGTLLIVEKVLGAPPPLTQDLLVRHYHAHKSSHGYTAEQIDRKRLALQGVLVPVAANWNVRLLETAGFHHIECYWRHLNFAAWIAKR